MSRSYDDDVCIEDPIISGQQFCCISLVYPELSIAERRALFLAGKFLGALSSRELNAVSEQASRFIQSTLDHKLEALKNSLESQIKEQGNDSEQSQVAKIAHQWLTTKLTNLVPTEEEIRAASTRTIKTDPKEIEDAFIIFHGENYEALEELANQVVGSNKKPTITGLKIRGSYATEEAARKRAMHLRTNVEPAADVLVAEVGKWIPLHPNIESIEDQQYAQKELNSMIGQMKDRQAAAKQYQQERIEAAKRHSNQSSGEARAQRARAAVRAKLEQRRREKQLVSGSSLPPVGLAEVVGISPDAAPASAHTEPPAEPPVAAPSAPRGSGNLGEDFS